MARRQGLLSPSSVARKSTLLLLLYLLLFGTVASEEGARNPDGTESGVVVVSTDEEFQDAITGIQSGQTIRLNLEEVQLHQEIRISDLTGIALEGMETVTKIRCPGSGSVLNISHSDMSVSFLEFEGCMTAIEVEWSRVRIHNCTFLENKRSLNLQSMKVDLLLSFDNRMSVVYHRYTADGGALYAYNSQLKIQNCSFVNNSAKDWRGGAIYFKVDNDLEGALASSGYLRNVVRDPRRSERYLKQTGHGSDVDHQEQSGSQPIRLDYSWCKSSRRKRNGDKIGQLNLLRRGAELFITDSHFEGNKAKRGGAIYVESSGRSFVELCITRSRFKNNEAGFGGGGINVRTSGESSLQLEVVKTHLENNKAGNDGGGIHVETSGAFSLQLEVVKTRLENNEAGNDGGGIHVETSGAFSLQLEVVKTRLENNEAGNDGGGINVRTSGESSLQLEVVKTHLENNTAGFGGGGINVWTSDESSLQLEVVKTHLENNEAGSDGGGINVWTSGESSLQLEVVKTRLENNEAGNGGGINVQTSDESSLQLEVVKTHLENNTADHGGGGIYVGTSGESSLQFKVVNTRLENNEADHGGGINVWTYGESSLQLEVVKTRLENNTADHGGGGIHVGTSSAFSLQLEVAKTRLENNEAGDDGGGISPITLFGAKSALVSTGSLFENNKARGHGRAIHLSTYQTHSVDLNISDVRFEYNKAGNGGAICVETKDRFSSHLAIAESHFKGNEAVVHGGGMYVEATGFSQANVRMESGKFAENSASEDGGAIYLKGSSLVECFNCTLETNSANRSGGAAFVGFQAFFIAEDDCSFNNNTGSDGGAISCERCGALRLAESSFSQNVAKKAGGAVHLLYSLSGFSVETSVFEENVAFSGAAVFSFGSTLHIQERYNKKRQKSCLFTKNTACSGGALYVTAPQDSVWSFKIFDAGFVGNRAIDCKDLPLTDESEALERWNLLWEDEEEQIKHFLNKEVGKGGAVFLSSEGPIGLSRQRFTFRDLNFTNNYALVGGGAYFDNSPEREDDRSRSASLSGLNQNKEAERSFDVSFYYSQLTDNKAKYAAGGFFFAVLPVPEHPVVEDSQCQDHILLAICKKLNSQVVPCLDWENNRVEDGGYGPTFGMGPHYLHYVQQVDDLGTFTDGDKLIVREQDSSLTVKESPITLEVKDVCNRTIDGKAIDTGNSTYSLGLGGSATFPEFEVVLKSQWISGRRKYKPVKGIIRINDTYASGFGINSSLLIACENCGTYVNLTFSMELCSDGELDGIDKKSCFRCLPSSYTFDTVDNCTIGWIPCETHAICSGTRALVPEKGYWHSTPFSPFMHRCLSEKACSRHNRDSELLSFYEDSDAIMKRIAEFNKSAGGHLDGYNQCSTSYRGVLCGSCEGNFARRASGECEECKHSIPLTWILTALRVCIVTVAVGAKVYLSWTSVKDAIKEELRQQAFTISESSGTEQRRPLLSQSSVRAGSSPTQQASQLNRVHRLNVQQGQITNEETVEESQGSSRRASAEIRRDPPALCRAEHIEDPLLSLEGTIAPSKTAVASGLLSSIYNIAFNYVQLTSMALSFEVDWKGFQKLLSLQQTVGRLAMSEFSPLGCIFPDRDQDEGINNSILSLWSQVCFPIFAVCLYLIVASLVKFFGRETRRSRYQVGFVSSAHLVAIVVLLSLSIDISTLLLKVFDCVRLGNSIQRNHTYAKFEVLDPVSLWTEDTEVRCHEGAHLVSSVLAAAAILFLAVGFISLAFSLWRGKRTWSLGTPEFMSKFGFLYSDYREHGLSLFWELVITVRRILIAAIGVFAAKNGSTNPQIGLMAIVIFISIALHTLTKPFEEMGLQESYPSYAGSTLRRFGARRLSEKLVAFNKGVTLNSLEGMSLYSTLSVFLTAITLNGSPHGSSEASLVLFACFAFNCLFSAFLIYRIWYALHHVLDIVALERGLDIPGRSANYEEWNALLLYKAWMIWRKPGSNEEATAAEDA